MITRLVLAFVTAVTLCNCVEPAPPPPAPAPAPYCPPKKVAYCPPKTQPQEPGRVVEGRFIRDTPAELLQPAKTIRIEKDF